MLATAVGLGLVVSLLLGEVLGMSSAGMVVPGYLALLISQPVALLACAVVAGMTYGFLRLLGSFLVIYGRRRTAVAILTAYVLGMVAHELLLSQAKLPPGSTPFGFIVPGLLAIWMDRQGLLDTLSSVTVTTVIVRLGLLLLFGADSSWEGLW